MDGVVEKRKAEGIDGAVVMRLIEENNAVVYDPGYLRTEIALRVESAFFSVADEKRVWTGYRETLSPRSVQVVIDEVVRLVVQEPRREGRAQ